MSKITPLIVYVSGASGSGKTTLAAKIAQQLYLPHVNSDLIKHGVKFTTGDNDRKQITLDVYVPLLVVMAQKNISFVADSVLYADTSLQDIVEPLKEAAKVINIHLVAESSIERFYAREQARADNGVYLTHEQLQERAVFHKQNLPNTQSPLALGVPQLIVNTNNDYDPDFQAIIDFIVAQK